MCYSGKFCFSSILNLCLTFIINVNTNNDSELLVLNYLENEVYRHFGEFNDIKSISIREEALLKQLKKFGDQRSNFLIKTKLFSRLINQEMVENDKNLEEAYYFQKEILDIFIHFYNQAKIKNKNNHKAEIQTAKILWNIIDEDKLEQVIYTLLENPKQSITPKKRLDYLERFKVLKNLIRIVQSNNLLEKVNTSSYSDIKLLIEKATSLYKNGKYKEMILNFELSLNKIHEYLGLEAGAIFATLVGSLLIQRSSNVSRGLYFLTRGEKMFEQLSDLTPFSESLGEMASAFWSLGMYKKTLDKLSTEIHLHATQMNVISLMYSQEKLSSFFRSLSRYIESHQWALQYLNSAIGLDGEIRGLHFLTANLNYVWTLLGLNSWPKVERHITYAEKALNQIELPLNYKEQINLELNTIKGFMFTIRGKFNEAKQYFFEQNILETQFHSTSPIFSCYLRSKAILFRNQRLFSEAIEVLQPLFQEKDTLNPRNVSLLAEILALHEHEKEALRLLDHALETLSNWNTIHGLSRIYLCKGYINLLMENFDESKRWYQQALAVTGSDYNDLKVKFEANSNLGYIALEEKNLEVAEGHTETVEEVASFSGSLAFLLDALLLKANLLFAQKKDSWAMNTIQRVIREAKALEIDYVLQKAKYQLENSSPLLSSDFSLEN